MEKATHGGHRGGSGRKPKNVTNVGFRIPNDVLAMVTEEAERTSQTKTDVINSILRKHYGL